MKSATDAVYKPKDLYGIPGTQDCEDVGEGAGTHDHSGSIYQPFKGLQTDTFLGFELTLFALPCLTLRLFPTRMMCNLAINFIGNSWAGHCAKQVATIRLAGA